MIDMMKKKFKNINYRNLSLVIVSVLFEVVIFYISKIFATKDPYVLTSTIDRNIPFIPFFVYFYILWYITIVLVPYIISIYDMIGFKRYILSVNLGIFISFFIFIIFPTTIIRPEVEVTSISTFLVSLIYKLDNATVCLPSMHVLLATLYSFPLIKNDKIPKNFKIFVWSTTILITLSTLFIKQHVIYDAIVAIMINIFTWNISKLFIKKCKSLSNN